MSVARIDVIMPQMGESIVEGTVSKWLKKVGDSVKRDEPIFEISTDKVDAEIPSPSAGTLAEILVPEGQTVPVQTVVARLETEVGAALAVAAAPPPSAVPARAAPAVAGAVAQRRDRGNRLAAHRARPPRDRGRAGAPERVHPAPATPAGGAE